MIQFRRKTFHERKLFFKKHAKFMDRVFEKFLGKFNGPYFSITSAKTV